MRGGTVIAETDYAYNADTQRLQTVTIKGMNGAADQVYTYHYKPNTNLVSSVSGSVGLSTDYAYDPQNGRLTGITAAAEPGPVFSSALGYNNVDQVTSNSVTQANADGSTNTYSSTYGYDNADPSNPNPQDQLVSVTSTTTTGLGGPINASWAYDGAGNGTNVAGAANALDQYAANQYDAHGNTLSDGVNTYTYDVKDRLQIGAGGPAVHHRLYGRDRRAGAEGLHADRGRDGDDRGVGGRLDGSGGRELPVRPVGQPTLRERSGRGGLPVRLGGDVPGRRDRALPHPQPGVQPDPAPLAHPRPIGRGGRGEPVCVLRE